MMRRTLLGVLAVLAVLGLTGCGGAPVKITDNMVNEAGDVVQTVVTETADVDAINSTNFTKMRMNRDNKQASTYKDSGFKMEFMVVDVAPGFKAYLPKEITFRPELRFADPMPLQQPENPVYKFGRDVFLAGFDALLKGFGIYTAGMVYEKGVENAATQYRGPYAPNTQTYNDSFNQTATPFFAPTTP
jgi:hypothetical protein